MFQVLFGGLTLSTAIGSAANANVNTNACYGSNVISTPSEDHRPIRTALDDIDDQILDLLNQRAAYVREATRFKSTRASVNVPSRNEAVLKQAEQQAVHIGVPVTIARAAIGAILNSSVPFEECIFDAYTQ
ncbi:Chorismate mutase [Penicillium expansum]|nr:Chorismate mutase [Penicillium expansum]